MVIHLTMWDRSCPMTPYLVLPRSLSCCLKVTDSCCLCSGRSAYVCYMLYSIERPGTAPEFIREAAYIKQSTACALAELWQSSRLSYTHVSCRWLIHSPCSSACWLLCAGIMLCDLRVISPGASVTSLCCLVCCTGEASRLCATLHRVNTTALNETSGCL